MDTLAMLEELLEQDQFELLIPKDGSGERLRLVYLMNDAVESFLVFENARMTGAYLEDYEDALTYSISKDGLDYVLVVWQGEHAVTILFEKLELEVHLYDYGTIAHFWVPRYEYLRQLEYRIAILRDKYEYLGPEYCTPEEQKLVHLAYFPPLNYCCYPAVPEKYIVPIEDPWNPSEQALDVMEELAKEARNRKLEWMLLLYRRFPYPFLAKRIAAMLHRTTWANVVDLLDRRLRQTVENYPRRSFGEQTDQKIACLEQKAENRKRKLEEQGIRAEVLREEPFTTAQDSLAFHVYLMIWEIKGRDRLVRIETIVENKEKQNICYGGSSMKKGKVTTRKMIAMVLGIVIMSAGVAIFKESGLGNDPQNATLMRISDLTGISFGNMVVGMSGLYFLLEIAFGRKYIGLGTFVNWLGCGYIITFFYDLLQRFFGTPANLGQQLVWLIPGMLIMGLGVSLYQTADLGISPYDHLALFVRDRTHGPYFVCRVAVDGFFAVVCFCIGGLLGLGTILSALCLGPFVSFFDQHISVPFVGKGLEEHGKD